MRFSIRISRRQKQLGLFLLAGILCLAVARSTNADDITARYERHYDRTRPFDTFIIFDGAPEIESRIKRHFPNYPDLLSDYFFNRFEEIISNEYRRLGRSPEVRVFYPSTWGGRQFLTFFERLTERNRETTLTAQFIDYLSERNREGIFSHTREVLEAGWARAVTEDRPLKIFWEQLGGAPDANRASLQAAAASSILPDYAKFSLNFHSGFHAEVPPLSHHAGRVVYELHRGRSPSLLADRDVTFTSMIVVEKENDAITYRTERLPLSGRNNPFTPFLSEAAKLAMNPVELMEHYNEKTYVDFRTEALLFLQASREDLEGRRVSNYIRQIERGGEIGMEQARVTERLMKAAETVLRFTSDPTFRRARPSIETLLKPGRVK